MHISDSERSDSSLLFNLTLSSDSPPRTRLTRRRVYFEPDDTASEELWDKRCCTGAKLVAAMLGSDEEAGKMYQDQRTPPSLASRWQGDLKRKPAWLLSNMRAHTNTDV